MFQQSDIKIAGDTNQKGFKLKETNANINRPPESCCIIIAWIKKRR